MGVVYKLKPEIKAFIIEKKKANPLLSCRSLVGLVETQFKIKVSKSSINTLFKQAGLSLSVGRRPQAPAAISLESVSQLAEPQEVKEIQTTETPGQPEIIELSSPESMQKTLLPAPAIGQPSLVPGAEVLAEQKAEVPVRTFLTGETTGAILLKAADYLVRGSDYIHKFINSQLNLAETEPFAKTEALIYCPIYDLAPYQKLGVDSPLWTLIHQQFTAEELLTYLKKIQQIPALSATIYQNIPLLFKPVRGLKVTFSDGSTVYLDGQFRTTWSTPYIPYYFSSTQYKIKSYINKCFEEDAPLVMFTAPGYEMPTSEFFDLIFSLNSPAKKRLHLLTLFGVKFEELEVINLEQVKKQYFIFGLWPWQFIQYRKVNKINEFKPFFFEPLKKQLYIAEIEIQLSQPNINKEITLKGCALKTNLEEKTRLVILSNLTLEAINLEQLANLYLGHWPNLEEAFGDYSRKIELFTYTASAQRFFPTEELARSREQSLEITSAFSSYLKALDLFVRWHFLPAGYEDKDFSILKEQFYERKVVIRQEKDYLLVTFKAPLEYSFFRELNYACCRLNEHEISSADGKRYWFQCLIDKPQRI